MLVTVVTTNNIGDILIPYCCFNKLELLFK